MNLDLSVVLAIGLGAGVMAGMFGIGGGVVMVPALIAIMGFSIVQANGTSLAALMMPVGIFAVMEYKRKGLTDFRVAGIFAIGLLLGVYFGARFAIALPSDILKQLYGIFLLWVSWKFAEPKKLWAKIRNLEINSELTSVTSKEEKSLPWYILLPVGILAGILSGLFGIGGGLLIVPLLVTFMNFSPKKAVGTSLAALLLPVALPGVIEYYNAGQLHIQYAAFLAGGLVIGSIAGAKITIALPTATVKRVYALFLLIMGLDFLITGFY
jgi:uncharacterized membrane protein YfcA